MLKTISLLLSVHDMRRNTVPELPKETLVLGSTGAEADKNNVGGRCHAILHLRRGFKPGRYGLGLNEAQKVC